MDVALRRFWVLVTALAIVLVSATCTSAGCVLPRQIGSKPAAHISCCAGQSNSADGQGQKSDKPTKKPCPICGQPLVPPGSVSNWNAHFDAPNNALTMAGIDAASVVLGPHTQE